MGKIYDSEYGSNVVGRFESGKIYDSEYGSNVIGRCESGKIYNSEYGSKVVGHYDGPTAGAAAAAFLLLL